MKPPSDLSQFLWSTVPAADEGEGWILARHLEGLSRAHRALVVDTDHDRQTWMLLQRCL